mmetsp:Transcript_39553/g.57761  ORF Transcript_39553/g.57761 Transcript_39553/m.57761 type:complete len:205 (+) Transcript_39553:118-732(+)
MSWYVDNRQLWWKEKAQKMRKYELEEECFPTKTRQNRDVIDSLLSLGSAYSSENVPENRNREVSPTDTSDKSDGWDTNTSDKSDGVEMCGSKFLVAPINVHVLEGDTLKDIGHRLIDVDKLGKMVGEIFCCMKCNDMMCKNIVKKEIMEFLAYADKEHIRVMSEMKELPSLPQKVRKVERELRRPSKLYKVFHVVQNHILKMGI